MNSRILNYSLGLGLAVFSTTWAPQSLAQSSSGLVINDVTVPETNSGSVVATFTVSFADSAAHGSTIVFITTSAGTATSGGQCGAPGVDFVGANGLSVTMSPSERSKQISITVCGDTRDEADQTFFVNITARGAPVLDAQGQATIVDDDPPPVLKIIDGRVTEGPAGSIASGGFTLSVVGLTDNVVRVQFTTTNRSAVAGLCGSAGADYERASGTLTNTSNQSSPNSQTMVIVRICGDSVREGDQQFEVQLSNATNATIQDGSGVVTIADDEPVPTLSITPTVLVSEPTALLPQSQAVFTVTLVGPPTELPVAVQYSTAPGTASAGSVCAPKAGDYITQTGTLTFPAAKSTQQIQVPICADSTPNEANETFTVTLTRVANAVISQGVGTATIR